MGTMAEVIRARHTSMEGSCSAAKFCCPADPNAPPPEPTREDDDDEEEEAGMEEEAPPIPPLAPPHAPKKCASRSAVMLCSMARTRAWWVTWFRFLVEVRATKASE